MQRRNRWIFLLMGCAGVVNGLVRFFQADAVGMFFSFVFIFLWLWYAYRPPSVRSRASQWVLYGLAVVAIFVIVSNVYAFLG